MATARRVNVRLSERHMQVLLERAAAEWPESKDNMSDLIRQILMDWDHIRDNTGGKHNRVLRAIRDHDDREAARFDDVLFELKQMRGE